ncbi:TRBP2 protein, partial [Grallaria varia]|nr:TRBP2 protein [Grallaria varia]
SLEQMVAASPGKTPISLLQEYGTRLGRTPGYDLLKAEGQAHQPNFTFRVTLGDISCTVLPVLGPIISAWGQLCLFWGPCFGAVYPQNKYPHLVLAYPHFVARCPLLGASCLCCGVAYPRFGCCQPLLGVAVLVSGCPCPTPPCPQELVVQKGWRLPEYTVTQESGPAHRKEFTMTCRVERFVEIGSGTSKKLAKRNAAAKMLVRIHNVPMEPRDGSEAEGEEDQFNMTCPRLEGLRGRAPGCTWDSLRNSAGEKLGQLR